MTRFYMKIAEDAASMSRGRRLKVGAVAVTPDELTVTGWNGTPKGWDNNCEFEENGKLITKPEVLHAELNVMTKFSRSTVSSQNATMYLTHSPCIECSKIMYQGGIKKVVYKDDYRDSSGVDFLRKCGILVCKI